MLCLRVDFACSWPLADNAQRTVRSRQRMMDAIILPAAGGVNVKGFGHRQVRGVRCSAMDGKKGRRSASDLRQR